MGSPDAGNILIRAGAEECKNLSYEQQEIV